MLTILHASDLHFGKHFDPTALEAFQEILEEVEPDLLVFSGDFTQRAKVREYQQAREFLAGLPQLPLVVTPGNHDVPLYRVWERLFAPLRNYRSHISSDLDTVTRIPGATVVALNSTDPHRAIVNGRLEAGQLRFAGDAFRDAPGEDLRILVTHHNLAPPPDYRPEAVLPGYKKILDELEDMGVELVLGGHLHRAYAATAAHRRPRGQGARGLIMVHSGTTMSRRGRTTEVGRNSLNLIRGSASAWEVTHLVRGNPEGGFQLSSTHTFPRGLSGGLSGFHEKGKGP